MGSGVGSFLELVVGPMLHTADERRRSSAVAITMVAMVLPPILVAILARYLLDGRTLDALFVGGMALAVVLAYLTLRVAGLLRTATHSLVSIMAISTVWLIATAPVGAASAYWVFVYAPLAVFLLGNRGAIPALALFSALLVAMAWLRFPALADPLVGSRLVLTFLLLCLVSIVAERTRELTLRRLEAEVRGHRQTQAELDEAHRATERLLEQAPLALFTEDMEGRVTHWNAKAHELTGWTQDQIVGRSSRVLWPEQADVETAEVMPVAPCQPFEDLEVPLRRKDGTIRIVSTSMAWDRDENGETHGSIQGLHDITEQRMAEGELRKLYSAVEQSPAVIIITDASGRIEFVNPAFGKVTGYAPDEVIGLTPALLKSGHHDDAFYEEMWSTLLSGREWWGEICNKRRDGELFWESASISPILDDDGTIAHFVSVKEDITERKHQQEELERLNRTLQRARAHAETLAQQAQQASVAKTKFLANMSHEIRTPMNGVMGMCSLLLATDLDEEQQDFARHIHASAEALLHIINDVLDFSKIEAGMLRLDPIPVELDRLLEEVVANILTQAGAKGLKLVCHVAPELPPHLVVDPVRLRQVLVNLAANAVKFTNQGSVTLSATCVARLSEDRMLVRFAVRDTGIGIPADKLDAIFSEFSQADDSTSRRFGGTGLGLSISRQLVELMGGELTVQSEEGVGSEFGFTIAAAVATETREQEAAGQQISLPSGLRVLVAEDNPVNQLVARRHLERMGCQVHMVVNGQEALDAVRAQPWDLVLMDCQMPVMDGYEATRSIRRLPGAASQVRVIAMTAHAVEGAREKCIAAGMDDYVSKPVHPRLLRQTLAQWTERPPPTDLQATAATLDLPEEGLRVALRTFVRVTREELDEVEADIEAESHASVARRASSLAQLSEVVLQEELNRSLRAMVRAARVRKTAALRQGLEELRYALDQLESTL